MALLRALGGAIVRLLRRLAGRLGDRLQHWSESYPDVPEAVGDVASSDDAQSEDAAPREAAPRVAAPRESARENDGRSTAENVTTTISILLIAILGGTILYEGYATGRSDPATLEVSVLTEQIEQRGDSYYVPVEIVNDGDQTVEEVAVSIELLDGEQVVAEGETVIATLGEAEAVKAVLVVSEDPTGLEIIASVVTYQIAED